METILSNQPTRASLWTGRIISGLCILFFLFDAIGKIIKEIHSIKGSVAVGLPENTIQGIGITLLICTILYLIPRTAIFGAILLTGYLGGAIAIMVRANMPVYFAGVFAILTWLGLYLRDSRVRTLLS